MQTACLHTAASPAVGRRAAARRLLARARSLVTAADRTLALWHERACYRREIERMDERLLRDAGLDRAEAFKPFWKP